MSFNLASNNSAVVVPATVTVPASATSAAFTATVSAVTTAQTATLTAAAGAASKPFRPATECSRADPEHESCEFPWERQPEHASGADGDTDLQRHRGVNHQLGGTDWYGL